MFGAYDVGRRPNVGRPCPDQGAVAALHALKCIRARYPRQVGIFLVITVSVIVLNIVADIAIAILDTGIEWQDEEEAIGETGGEVSDVGYVRVHIVARDQVRPAVPAPT